MPSRRPARRSPGRSFAPAAAFSALALLAAGCGGQAGTSAASRTNLALDCHGCGHGKTLTVQLDEVGTPQQLTSWETYVARQFTRDTGAHVKYLNVTTSDQDLNTIEVGATTHTGPDVDDVDNAFIGSADAAKAFRPITPTDWHLLGGRSRFTSLGTAQNLTGPDTIGWYTHNDLLLYNTKLFREAGVSGPPKTWTQYVDDARKITALGHGIYGAPFEPLDSKGPWHIIYALTRDLGGNFINKAGTKATMTSPAVVKAVEFYFGWYLKGLAPPQTITADGTQLLSIFSKNKLGMLNLSVPSNATALAGTPAAHDWAWAPMPTVPYGQSTLPPGAPKTGFLSLQFGYDWGVTSWSKEPDLGFRFINIATSRDAELLLYRYTEDLPTNRAASAVVQKNPTSAIFLKYGPVAIPSPPVSYWGTVEVAVAGVTTTLARDVQNRSYSQAAVISALQKADSQIDAAIASTKG